MGITSRFPPAHMIIWEERARERTEREIQEREKETDRMMIDCRSIYHTLSAWSKRVIYIYIYFNQYPSTTVSSKFSHERDRVRNERDKVSERTREKKREKERERESTAPHKLQSSCCIELWTTAQSKGNVEREKKQQMSEYKRQCAARLLNINGFIYM